MLDTLGDTVWSYMLDPNWDGVRRDHKTLPETFWDGFSKNFEDIFDWILQLNWYILGSLLSRGVIVVIALIAVILLFVGAWKLDRWITKL